jgi:rare lipoprotein A
MLGLRHFQKLLLALLILSMGCAHRSRTPQAPRSPTPRSEAVNEAAPQARSVPPFPQNASQGSSLPSSNLAPDAREPFQSGQATWYGDAFAGRKTASGERFNPADYTAAHRTLPFGTLVLVQRISNGRQVRVRITDRGPFGSERRIIDLSKRAASELDMVRTGVADVTITILGAR